MHSAEIETSFAATFDDYIAISLVYAVGTMSLRLNNTFCSRLTRSVRDSGSISVVDRVFTVMSLMSSIVI